MSLQPDHDTITRPDEEAILDDLGKLAAALTSVDTSPKCAPQQADCPTCTRTTPR
ncbi:MAG TPA: hypothetical protein VGI74_19280 [Streptosporangiaceae bacterium]